ncbi:hypothetical protein FFONT_0430 [Fervidicoccus fontis Kam940]|uniref:DUF72 domain-containing protein n=3 Tax=Fervidicoccus fontis TaxID=683846 RepID=I0A0B3_FERFK|nr:hypothetical protein FFONT_0430 [Fervidicoccus fontis Kam940]
MKRVFSLVDVVEIQKSFYDLLSDKEISNILKNKRNENKITLKCWQVITHPSTSPTWKKMKNKINGEINNYGYLKPTKENFEAFSKVVDQARKLNAEVIVLQSPPSMPYDEYTKDRISSFFKEITSIVEKNIKIAWEPRGKYAEDDSFLEKIENEKVEIVTDALRRGKIFYEHFLYIRLHGLGGKRETNYKYKYTDEDLISLSKLIGKAIVHNKNIYVLFNNIFMLEDAVRFKKLMTGAIK